MIQNHILESTENLRTAFDVMNSLKQVKDSLKAQLSLQMHDLAQEYDGIYHEEHRHFEFSKLKNTYIKFNYEMGGVIYGIVKTPAFEKIYKSKMPPQELMDQLGGKFKTSHWWPLYHLKYEAIDVNPEFWIAIVENDFKQFMGEFIKRVLNAPNEMTSEL